MKIKLLHRNAIVPKRGSSKAAGFDLHSIEQVNMHAGATKLIHTGISAQTPTGCYLRIAPRSGLALEHNVDVLAGVIDADYTGEINVLLVNNGKYGFIIDPGDRIAQLIPERIWQGEIEVVDDLNETERSDDGFGSTGL